MRRLLGILGWVVGGVVLLVGTAIAWLWLRSPAMRPASAETIARTPARLERGKYLVEHLSECMSCHSDHEYDKFGAPVKPGTEGSGGFTFDQKLGVPGVVTAQNLTPDVDTGKATWTDGELVRAIREGVSRDGHALIPMMQYGYFRSMSDEDVRSVVAYLRTLRPVKNPIPPTKIDFPVNLLIKFAPRPVDAPIATPDDAKDHLAYGKYLATIGICRECHSAHDKQGQIIAGREFAGGWDMHIGSIHVVTANITPHKDTFVGQATKEQFIARFKSFVSVAENPPPASRGRNTLMPWLAYAGLTEKDLGAIYDYLRTLSPIENHVESFPDAG
jgi:mono/diheme cytochrome c family protein